MEALNSQVPAEILPQLRYLLSVGVGIEDLSKVAIRELLLTQRKGTIKKILHRPELIKSKVEFYQQEFNLDGATIGKMIVRAASGLFSQQADSLRSKIDVLYKIGLDKYTVAKLLSSTSGLLSLKVETLEKRVDSLEALLSTLESGEKQLNTLLLKVITTRPNILARRPEKLSEILAVLSEYGFTKEEVLGMVSKNPNILVYDINSTVEKFEFMKGKGFEQHEMRAFFSLAPKLFDLSIEKNLSPTLQFFLDTGWTISSLIAFPTVINYSLPSRIKPRFHFLKKKLPAYDPVGRLQWITQSDADFATKLVKCTQEEWASFKKQTL
jgi:hypothetical protein